MKWASGNTCRHARQSANGKLPVAPHASVTVRSMQETEGRQQSSSKPPEAKQ